jgi:hypothetical protein
MKGGMEAVGGGERGLDVILWVVTWWRWIDG